VVKKQDNHRDLDQVNEELIRYVKPLTYPIAFKMLTSADQVPEIAKTPLKNWGKRDMLCKCVTAARRYGWIMACGKEDNICSSVSVAFGFYSPSPAFLEGEFQAPIQKIYKEERAKERQAMPKFEYGKYSHTLIVPLFRAKSIFHEDFMPDVIALYALPAQVLHLTEGLPASEVQAVAMGGACINTVVRTMLTDKISVIMPCPGDRIAGGTQDWEVIFSMPTSKVDFVMTRLEETNKARHRYPIPTQIAFDSSMLPESYHACQSELEEYEKTVRVKK